MKKIAAFILSTLLSVSLITVCALANGDDNITASYSLIDTSNMTELQEAIVVTAESFYLRGNRAQYDMGTMVSSSTTLERRLVKEKAPEDYTLQNVGYTDCSGFVYDVYWDALGMKIVPVSSCWTKEYLQANKYIILRRYPESNAESFDTPEELEAEKKAFLDALQPGDIIVYRYVGDTGGHTMLYAGNGMMFHSSGDSYKTADKTERYEESGSYLYDSVEEHLFNPESKRYLFKKNGYAILRPLDKFADKLPKKTRERVSTMRGVMAEKLSSHPCAQTVNLGEKITFTFSVTNYDTVEKTLTIQDTVPKNTVYVSGDFTAEKDKLSYILTLPAGETAKVSYTVQVKNDLSLLGEKVVSNSNIEKIPVNCPAIFIKETLSKEEQKALVNTVEKLKNSDLRNLSLASAAYKEAWGKSSIDGYSSEDILLGIFKNNSSKDEKYKILNTSGKFKNILAPNLYGGTLVIERSPLGSQANLRTRMVTPDKLVVGDIIICKESENVENYMFLGNELLNLSSLEKVSLDFLDKLLGYQIFAVIRPSNQNDKIILTMDDKNITVFGERKENDVAPKIVNGIPFLPIRFVAENLGAEVIWKEEEPKKVVVIKADTEIVINIGSNVALINKKEVKLEGEVFLENDRTYVPFKLIFESLGAKVEYLPEAQQVIVEK